MADPRFFGFKKHFQFGWKGAEMKSVLEPSSVTQTCLRKYSSSKLATRNMKDFKGNRGRVFLINAGLVLIGCLGFEYYQFRRNFKTLLPRDPTRSEDKSTSHFIYETDPMFLKISFWKSLLLRLSSPAFSVQCRDIIYRSIQETNSRDPATRDAAIRTLAGLRGLLDMEAYQIASSITFKTAVALANSAADPRFVDIPRGAVGCYVMGPIAEKMRWILNELPQKNIHEEVLKSALAAIEGFDPTYEEYYQKQLERATSFESDLMIFTNPNRRLSEVNFLIPCLEAILSHTRLYEQIPVINECGVLQLLAAIVKRHRGNRTIMSLVVRIIANLTWHESTNQYVERAGILRILLELALDTDIKIYLPARKALHNLDRESNKGPLLPPGVFQLYPSFRFDDDELDVDIIFIHGLMGGVFRTWRRHDKAFRSARAEGCIELDTASRAFMLRLQGAQRNITPLVTELEEDLAVQKDEASRLLWAQRLRSIRSRMGVDDKEPVFKPANREMINGEMFYFPEDEIIELEPPGAQFPSGNTKCWPKDWLPKDIRGARVIGIDFESFVSLWNPIRPIESLSRSNVERSAEILEKLVASGVGKRPIVWVTHSAGGILLKYLLKHSSQSHAPSAKVLSENTKAVLFYSTPHFGSHYAAFNSAGKLILLPTIELKELNPDSNELRKLNEEFKALVNLHQYRIVSFGEKTEMISTFGYPMRLVPLQSSDPGYGDYYALDLNHLDICKPVSRGSFIYRKLVDVVLDVRKSIIEDPPGQ